MGLIGYFQGAIREYNSSKKTPAKKRLLRAVMRQFDTAIQYEELDKNDAEVKALISKFIDLHKEVD